MNMRSAIAPPLQASLSKAQPQNGRQFQKEPIGLQTQATTQFTAPTAKSPKTARLQLINLQQKKGRTRAPFSLQIYVIIL